MDACKVHVIYIKYMDDYRSVQNAEAVFINIDFFIYSYYTRLNHKWLWSSYDDVMCQTLSVNQYWV